jgi:hypothetical protein
MDVGRLNIIKMSILLKEITDLMQYLSKIPVAFSVEIEKKILKFIWIQNGP